MCDTHWLIDYAVVRQCLRTAATSGPIVHPPGDMWTWRAMVMFMPFGDNSWLVHKSSLAVLPAETSRASRRNERRSENFAYQYLKFFKGRFTCRKILRRGISSFTFHPKEGVLRIFIALKNPSPRPGLNPRLLGPVASTLTTTPPRRLVIRRHKTGKQTAVVCNSKKECPWSMLAIRKEWMNIIYTSAS
jgi:hypothetical protein